VFRMWMNRHLQKSVVNSPEIERAITKLSNVLSSSNPMYECNTQPILRILRECIGTSPFSVLITLVGGSEISSCFGRSLKYCCPYSVFYDGNVFFFHTLSFCLSLRIYLPLSPTFFRCLLFFGVFNL
jgi:hypothetical protein